MSVTAGTGATGGGAGGHGGGEQPIRLLLVDDDQLVRAGLRMILGAEPDLEVVGEAPGGEVALTLAQHTDPDVVLMDVRMPGMDGIEATRRLVARDPVRPRVLVVTTFEHDDYVFDALAAGASGFVLKRAEPSELAQAIRIVAGGESLVLPGLTRRLVSDGARSRPRDEGGATQVDRLTAREAEILRLMAAGHSNAEIAEELFIGLQTVKTHVGNVLAKLEARDRTQAVITAYTSGFVKI